MSDMEVRFWSNEGSSTRRKHFWLQQTAKEPADITQSKQQALPMAPPNGTETPLSPSLLNTILPVAVRSCLPQLRSLRRSRSGCNTSDNRYVRHDGSYTAPKTEVCEPFRDELNSSACPIRLSSKYFSASEAPSVKDNGIGLKYANQGAQALLIPTKTQLTKSAGLGLLETAVAEASVPEPRNQTFSRQLYIHALAYLIQALPSDLSSAETVCLDDALSHGLRRHLQHNPPPSQTHQQTPSILHRLTASTIIQFFLVCQLLLPYIQYFLHKAYRYERTHRVSEKIFATSIKTGDRIGRLWWDIIHAISRLPDKKLAAMLASILLWWVEGISGGIHEGIGEGMSIIGVRRPDL